MHTTARRRSIPHPRRAVDKHKNRFVCAYDYCNEPGTVVFQKLRFVYLDPEAAGRSKTFRYWQPNERGSGWRYGKPPGADGLPYRLPELLAAVRGGARVIYVVEGEKDADVAAARGLVATTGHAGGGPGNKVTPAQAAWFMGYSGTVRIVADNDTTGYATAARWRTVLLGAGLREGQLQVVRARVGKDLADHLDAGRAVAGLRRVSVEELTSLAGEYTEERGTREGYGAFLRVSKERDELQEELMKHGYGRGAAMRLAWRMA